MGLMKLEVDFRILLMFLLTFLSDDEKISFKTSTTQVSPGIEIWMKFSLRNVVELKKLVLGQGMEPFFPVSFISLSLSLNLTFVYSISKCYV